MRFALALALLCHLVLAGGYWLITPALEAPREEDYVEAASRSALGFGGTDAYTLLLAGGLRLIGQPDLVATARPAAGSPAAGDPAAAHPAAADPAATHPPAGPGALRLQHGRDEVVGSPEQTALGVLRALSLLLGMVSIACTYAVAQRVFPDSGVAATACVLMACLPQWAFSHAVLWHGALLGATAHLSLLILVRAATGSGLRPRDGAGAGALAAIAIATAGAGWMVFVLGLVGHGLALRRRPVRRVLGTLALFSAITSVGLLATPAGVRTAPADGLAGVRGTLDLVRSFVAEFGRDALAGPPLPEVATLLMLLLALAGWGLGARRLAPNSDGLLLVSLGCSLGSMAGVSAGIREGWHGRSLLIAAGPMMIVTAAGLVCAWRRLAPAWARRLPVHPFAVLLPFAPSLCMLTLHVAPAMRLPPIEDARFVTLHGGLRTAPARGLSVDDVGEGPDTSVLRWHLDATVGSAAPVFAVIGWRDDGRVAIATHARDGIVLTEPHWRVPASSVADLAGGTVLSWRVYTVETVPERGNARRSAIRRWSPR